MSAIEDALGVLFADPTFAKSALWFAGGAGAGTPCNVTRQAPDEIASFGTERAVAASVLLKVRASEIAAPAKSDVVSVDPGGENAQYRIIAQPLLDAQRAVWSCEAASA